MKRLGLAVCVVVGLIAVAVNGNGGEKKDKNKGPDGTWVVVGMEQKGAKLPAEFIEKMSMKLTLKGENYTVTMGDNVHDKGTSTVNTKKKPYTADIKSEEGPNKGKTILAIIEIDGDSMKACYDMEGKGRPTEFSTKEDSGNVLILYKRETKK
jgi:uncharacterized protein (TIGR03067 family)